TDRCPFRNERTCLLGRTPGARLRRRASFRLLRGARPGQRTGGGAARPRPWRQASAPSPGSEVRALRQAGDKGAAAVHGRRVGTSRHAGVVGCPSNGETRLVRAAALRPRVYPLLMTIVHAGAARARTAAGLGRALRLLRQTGSRARHALARSEAAGEGRIELGLAVDGTRGDETDLLVGARLLDARGRARTERGQNGRRRGRRRD